MLTALNAVSFALFWIAYLCSLCMEEENYRLATTCMVFSTIIFFLTIASFPGTNELLQLGSVE